MSKHTLPKDPHAQREAMHYENPIPSREFILEHLKQRSSPALYSELLEELHLIEEERQEALHRRLKAMFRDGQIDRLKGGYFCVAPQRIAVEGTVLVEKGKHRKVWILPTDGSARISLAWEGTEPVYTGNKVLVATTAPEDETALRTGKLLEILEQARVLITGRFIQEAGFAHVIPHGKEKEVIRDILIPQGKEHHAIDGQMVVVELIKQPSRWADPLGQVVEILGDEETPGIEIEAAIRSYELPHVWSEATEQEAAQFGNTIPAAALRGRLDLRDHDLVTIDGEDAKDFDDAVYCEAKKDGGFTLIVAIADVSYYVRPSTALDADAVLRGNSVYFPGKVIPMLPEQLSNELCSLKPQVDRLCMACIMSISAQGKITRYAFHEAVMRSKARLTYTLVAELLRDPTQHLENYPAYADILPALKRLEALYKVLKSAREVRGAVEFESVETRIIFGENRKIERIEPVHRNDAHRIIEECMLSANVACARFLKKNKLPGLYRNHQGPSKEKLLDLRTFLSELGLSLAGGDEPTPLDYAKLLQSVQKRADALIIQTVLLRSLSQAVYAKDNLGHFGLAYPMYAHFTSPIRRYPDLLVHRQIRMILRGQWTEKKQAQTQSEHAQQMLDRVGEHVSMTERRADDAVRDVSRWLKCQYIQQHVGGIFSAIISGVTRFGFFAELKDLYIDGLVHVTSLRNDYYYFDAIYHRLVGERSGVSYKLGDSIQVKVIKVDVDDRKIDFELVDQPHAAQQGVDQKARKKKSRQRTPKSKSKAKDQGASPRKRPRK